MLGRAARRMALDATAMARADASWRAARSIRRRDRASDAFEHDAPFATRAAKEVEWRLVTRDGVTTTAGADG